MDYEAIKKEKERKRNIETGGVQTIFSANHSDIASTAVKQCAEHTWRKLNDTEIACTVCPTVNIVNNADKYIV